MYRSSYVARFSYNADDVEFKTISDPYTKSRMLPFLTNIDGVRANLFSINPRQIMTPTVVNQKFFFYRKIGSNKVFSF